MKMKSANGRKLLLDVGDWSSGYGSARTKAEKIIFKVNVQAITGLERQWQQNTKPDLWLNSIQKTFMRGQLKLVACTTSSRLTVTILGLRHLPQFRNSIPRGSLKIYLTIRLHPDQAGQRKGCVTDLLHVNDDSSVSVHETFTFDISCLDLKRRLRLSVWKKEDDINESSNLIGCMSFGLESMVKHKQVTGGWYFLLSERLGRRRHCFVDVFAKPGHKTFKMFESTLSASSVDLDMLEKSPKISKIDVETNSKKRQALNCAAPAKRARFFDNQESHSQLLEQETAGSDSNFTKKHFHSHHVATKSKTVSPHHQNGSSGNYADAHPSKHITSYNLASSSLTTLPQANKKTLCNSNTSCNHCNEKASKSMCGINNRRAILTASSVADHGSLIEALEVKDCSNKKFNCIRESSYPTAVYIPPRQYGSAKLYKIPQNSKATDVSKPIGCDTGTSNFSDQTSKFSATTRVALAFPNTERDDVGDRCPSFSSVEPTPFACLTSIGLPQAITSKVITSQKCVKETQPKLQTCDKKVHLKPVCEDKKWEKFTGNSTDSGKVALNTASPSKTVTQTGMEKENTIESVAEQQPKAKHSTTKKTVVSPAVDGCQNNGTNNAAAKSLKREKRSLKASTGTKTLFSWRTKFSKIAKERNSKASQFVKYFSTSSSLSSKIISWSAKNNVIRKVTNQSVAKLCPSRRLSLTSMPPLQNVLDNEEDAKLFGNFLRKEHSLENLEFWRHCEVYKRSNSVRRHKMAYKMFNRFIKSKSPDEVNLDHPIKGNVAKGLSLALPDLFDAAQEVVYNLMATDSYPRFLKSKLQIFDCQARCCKAVG